MIWLVIALVHFLYLTDNPCWGFISTFRKMPSEKCITSTRFTTASSTSTSLSLSISRAETDNDDEFSLSAFQFHVAPMQCYTNESMRQLFRALSSDAILWTEMEKVPDLLAADSSGLERRFGPPGERKEIVLQLGGNTPKSIQTCLTRLADKGYDYFDEINLNCGCPSIESGGGATFGASLMKDPDLTRQLLESISNHKQNQETKVSLKCRIGVVNDADEMTSMKIGDDDAYQRLYNYVSEAKQGGISHLALHARPAVLSGLSPVKNRQIPQLNYDIVQQVANDFPSLQVTLNGGINSISQLAALSQHQHEIDINLPSKKPISSFMAGRWMLRRPLDLAKLHCDRAHSAKEGSLAAEKAIHGVEAYASFVKMSVVDNYSSRTLDELCLPLFLITEQLREDYDGHDQEILKGPIDDFTTDNIWLCDEDIERIYTNVAETVLWLQDLRGGGKKKKKKIPLDVVDLKKLSASFKGLVGTKVANKWKRNRCEL